MQTISFYSFKGGAGRTVCCANMIPILAAKFKASKEHPILIMDMDLDSAGLTHILKMYDKFKNSSWVPTNLLTKGGGEEIILTNNTKQEIFFNKDYFGNHSDDEMKEREIAEREQTLKKITQILIEKGLPESKALIISNLNIRKSILSLLQKNIQDNAFINNLIDKLSFSNNADDMLESIEALLPASGMVDISNQFAYSPGSIYFIGTKQAILENVVSAVAKEKLCNIFRLCDNKKFSAILIDSASGNQQIANVIHEIQNIIIVYCLRLTTQFRRGTTIKLKDFIETATHNWGIAKVILLPVALPNKDYAKQSVLASLKEEAIDDLHAHIDDLKSITSSQQNPTVEIHDEFIDDGVPEVESFKWWEKILIDSKEVDDDERHALNVFKKLGDKIISISNK